MSLRRALRPLLIPILRRAPDEVERQLPHFSVSTDEGRHLVADVGSAFLGGYHAMLAARELSEVSALGRKTEPHFAPFFFEGAAMGYLPRATYTPEANPARAESDLLAMDPRFLYLYFVGLGFWYGFRHKSNPGALESLAPFVDPFYMPLCYDGFGFKVAFFDAAKRPAAREVLSRAPENRRAAIYQGFGRALFFVTMHDEERFRSEQAEAPAEYRNDIESGRSLALAFTGLRRPERILAHLRDAAPDQLGPRLLGVSWALTAREMNDQEHFDRCLASIDAAGGELLRSLPRRCREAKSASRTYEEWRMKTTAAAREAYAPSREARRT
jgi:hypothetical protein